MAPGGLRVAAQDTATRPGDRFVALAYYPYLGEIDDAKTALKPLLRLMQQQPGFITMSFIDGDEQIYLVTWFLDKTTSDAGMAVLDGWIEAGDRQVLGADAERDSGGVFLRSELDAGCWCSTGDEQACGSGDLYCCGTADDDRGICLTAATICPGTASAEEIEEQADDPTPTATATEGIPTPALACTGEGCDCILGLDGSCDDGLSCCGADELGGAGMCMTACPCGSEGCACIGSVVNTCDEGLTCCAPGEIGGEGTCQHACTCTGEGCACTTGVEGACDDGLSCCGIGSSAPGSIGACLSACATDAPCPGSEGCECGAVWKCNNPLACCGATEEGGTGICQFDC